MKIFESELPPLEWPVKNLQEYYSITLQNGNSFAVFFDANGQILIKHGDSINTSVRTIKTQVVNIPSGALVTLMCDFDDNTGLFKVYLNDHELLFDEHANGNVYQAAGKLSLVESPRTGHNLVLIDSLSIDERNFITKLAQIVRKSSSGSHYELLGLVFDLRDLLIGDNNLLNLANKEYNTDIIFNPYDARLDSKPLHVANNMCRFINIQNESDDNELKPNKGLVELLSCPMACFGDVVVSINDFIFAVCAASIADKTKVIFNNSAQAAYGRYFMNEKAIVSKFSITSSSLGILSNVIVKGVETLVAAINRKHKINLDPITGEVIVGDIGMITIPLVGK